MTNLLKSDIFFFVTTVGVVVFTAVLVIALFYLIRILKNIRRISALAREMAELFQGDVHKVRERIKEGASVAGVVHVLRSLFGKKKANRSSGRHSI